MIGARIKELLPILKISLEILKSNLNVDEEEYFMGVTRDKYVQTELSPNSQSIAKQSPTYFLCPQVKEPGLSFEDMKSHLPSRRPSRIED